MVKTNHTPKVKMKVVLVNKDSKDVRLFSTKKSFEAWCKNNAQRFDTWRQGNKTRVSTFDLNDGTGDEYSEWLVSYDVEVTK